MHPVGAAESYFSVISSGCSKLTGQSFSGRKGLALRGGCSLAPAYKIAINPGDGDDSDAPQMSTVSANFHSMTAVDCLHS